MIWVCILCRKKQELLIKTGTWMQSTAEMSSDPILRRMEQDMAATPTSSVPPHHRERLRLSEGGGGDGSNMSTPMNHPLSPATSIISSLFSNAMSFAGEYTTAGTPTMSGRSLSGRPLGPAPSGIQPGGHPHLGQGGHGRGSISRQKSLDSSDSGLSPCGYPSSMRPQSRLGMAPPPNLIRHRSEGGEDDLASNLSGGEATPTAPFPLSPSTYQRQSPRFHRPPMGRGRGYNNSSGMPRPYLSRGRSLGESPGSGFPGGAVSSSISFHNPPVTSNVATPIRSTFIEGVAAMENSSSSNKPYSHRIPIESMSAPEDAYHSPLYPRVLVSDSEARDICLPLALSDSAHMGGVADKNRLMDPRNMRTNLTNRRKLDSTFRNDSLSSDQSECLQHQQRPPPPKPHKHKKGGSGSSGHAHHSSGGHSHSSQQSLQV